MRLLIPQFEIFFVTFGTGAPHLVASDVSLMTKG